MSVQHGGTVVSRGWWISFLVLLASSVTFSVIVGNTVAGLDDPVELGHSVQGEWADLGDFGFRARLDDISSAESFPSAYDEGQEKVARDGTALLRVRFTIEPRVDQDETIGCSVQLLNGEGEQMSLVAYGVDGPASVDCSFIPSDAEESPGAAFQSQTVWVVPEPVDAYSVRMVPISGSGTDGYWTFTR